MKEFEQDGSGIAAAIAAGRAIGASIISVPDEGRPVIVVPDNCKVVDLEELLRRNLDKPKRISTVVVFENPESFVSYVKQHGSAATRIFVSGVKTNPEFVAVIDCHDKGNPSWNSHIAMFSAKKTEEWVRWVNKSNDKMDQVNFASFLEDNESIFSSPTGAEMLEMIQNLEGKADVKFGSATRLSSGKTAFNYTEDVVVTGGAGSQAGKVELPQIIEVVIAPFEGVSNYKLKSRLRYRLQSGQVTFWHTVIDPHIIIKDAVDDVVKTIKAGTGFEVLFGKPPSK